MSLEPHERMASSRQTHRWWRPRGLPLVELLVVGILLALVVPWGSLLARIRDDEPPRSVAYAHLTVDPWNGPRELVAFDESSGDVRARLPGGNSMSFVVHPDGTRLYLASTTRHDNGSTQMLLTVYETGRWTVEQQVELAGTPSAIALSPDGGGVMLLFYDASGSYWLERRDAASLEPVAGPQRAELPQNCGAWKLWTTTMHVLTQCAGNVGSVGGGTPAPLALHAVDLGSMQVVASLPLNSPDILRYTSLTDVVVSNDRATLYLIFGNLQIVEVDAGTLTLRRNVRDHARDTQRVGRVSAAPGQLLVAVMDTVGSSLLAQLRRFQLPSLEELPALSLPDGAWSFAAGADGMLYRWSSGSADVRLVDLASRRETPIRLAGPEPQGVVDIVRAGAD